MAAPRKYPDELRERATRMAVELRQDPDTEQGAVARVADQLGMHRAWFNHRRLHGEIGLVPPAEFGIDHWADQKTGATPEPTVKDPFRAGLVQVTEPLRNMGRFTSARLVAAASTDLC